MKFLKYVLEFLNLLLQNVHDPKVTLVASMFITVPTRNCKHATKLRILFKENWDVASYMLDKAPLETIRRGKNKWFE
jgi:hypothetical protein